MKKQFAIGITIVLYITSICAAWVALTFIGYKIEIKFLLLGSIIPAIIGGLISSLVFNRLLKKK